jgi:2-C-methyl-D-erythritol 4-phosphate cytidylyltransferase
MTTAVIIVAAGRGTRAGGDLPKQWQPLLGRPVVAHALQAMAGCGPAVLVIHPEDRALAQALCPGTALVAGGETRAASVRNALEALAGSGVTRVLIHDGARPLVSAALIARLMAALDDHAPGAAPALPVTDALWRGEGGLVAGTQDRSGTLPRADPAGLSIYDAILAAHRAHPGGAADDVEVARAAGSCGCHRRGLRGQSETHLARRFRPGGTAACRKGQTHGHPHRQRL